MLICNESESENLDDVDAYTPNQEMLIRNEGETEKLVDEDAYTPNEEMLICNEGETEKLDDVDDYTPWPSENTGLDNVTNIFSTGGQPYLKKLLL